MPKVLIDTGPMVAWLDRGDNDHVRVHTFLADFQGQLVTSWPVLTEVCHLLPHHIVPRFMRWAEVGVELHDLPPVAIADIAASMEKYHDLPMDLADASLVWLANRLKIREIITLDEKDLGIYRLTDGKCFRNLLF